MVDFRTDGRMILVYLSRANNRLFLIVHHSNHSSFGEADYEA